ncbi:MAG: hypothetical protein GXP24_10020 [Planctomycetes bacterium]|nr:hypothetical protein [Planctomycetota bacterium]
MNITYACPSCEEGVRIHFDADTPELDCPHCQAKIAIDQGAIEGNRVKSCLVCPSTDLFVRKDFPQRLGVGLVVVGIIGSSIAWYYSNILWTFGILFATALIDVALYSIVGDALMCYRCQAQYRGVEEMDTYEPFDLETHEKYRQLEARLEQ